MSEIICPISGLRMLSAPYMLGFRFKEIHPIFRAKRKDLITPDLAHRFSRAQETDEKRLYFLGVLYSTDLVTFNTIAKPSLRTIERWFLPAMQVAGWIDYAMYQLPRELSLPRYVVQPDNAEMDNVGVFLQDVDALHHDFERRNKDKELTKRMQTQTQTLLNDLSKAFYKDRVFGAQTVDWALEFTGIDKHPRAALFRSILLTPLKEAYGLDRDLLVELKDMFEEEFDAQHPMYAPFFGQFNQLITAQRKGFQNFEILLDDPVYDIVEDGEVVGRESISSQMEKKLFQQTGSLEKPNRKDFATLGQWQQATARWMLAQRAKPSEPQEQGENHGNFI